MMIEFSTLPIHRVDEIIEARKKIYYLALDLEMSLHMATYLATLTSETLQFLLCEQKTTSVKLAFTKELGHYYFHILISCSGESQRRLEKVGNYRNRWLFMMNKEQSYLELKSKIPSFSFIPNDAFLKEERERLIQQSTGEMLQEIRQKNRELNKALHDLKASTEMIQTEKMRALGSMTAGVAHELNNPMMGIMNFIQYAIKHTDVNDRRYRPLEDALREVNRCQDIISNLLTFARMKAEGEEAFSAIKLSILFERILQLHSYKLKSTNIEIIRKYSKEEPQVRIKENKMQQVILNLITNAIDAMQNSEKKELILTIEPHLNEMLFSVADTGSGIDEETLDKIFEPFFTTKATGAGTGLGLAVTKSIIDEHQGTISCQSDVGKGTCFTVTLGRMAALSDRKMEE